jgi:hypothetical protein
MLVAATLLLALLAGPGADADRPQPAEPAATFQCRARLQPGARRCAQACRTTLEREDEVFDCVAGCTARALEELAACRNAPAAPAPPLAAR